MQANLAQCFESWSEELKSRSDRVRNLIGSVHWLSDGHHKEEILRQFLIRHLSTRLRITRGFIRPSDPPELVSREIDALITDSEGELPWFAEGNLIIAPPSAALAQIHVKTKFNVEELTDVFKSGAHNDYVFKSAISNRDLWFGAIFFSASNATTQEKQRDIWKKAAKKFYLGSSDPQRFPDCVAIIDGPVFLGHKSSVTGQEQGVRAYNCGNASTAVFLSHLYDSITFEGKDLTRRGEWFRMITQVCKGPVFSQALHS